MMRDIPIFWSFRRCPYAMRARLAVKSAGLQVELREIILRNKPEAFLAASQSATVPVLELDTQSAIDESLDIMFWALEAGGDPEKWLTEWHENRETTSQFLAELDGKFKSDLDKYKYATRYTDETSEAADLAKHHRSEGMLFLEKIDETLSRQAFLNGSHAGLRDFASLPFVRQFRIADVAWFDAQDWPALHIWLQNFLKSSRFADIMHKYPPWKPEDKAIYL